MKYEKKLIILTSILILMPMLVGVILWNQLPEQLPFHWNAQGQVDQYMGKAPVVFGFPFFLLAIHLFCVFVTGSDPKNPNVVKKVNQLVLWICPTVSLFVYVMTYSTALNRPINVNLAVGLFTGLLLIMVGNYLPKCRPNYTIGIRLPWTLDSEENWRKTHRLAGPVTMAGGVIIVLISLVNPDAMAYMILPVVLLITLIPSVYSYLLYKRENSTQS